MTTQEELIKIKSKLPRGAQREIARRTGIHFNSVSLALGGFIVSDDINQKVLEEAKKILKNADSK